MSELILFDTNFFRRLTEPSRNDIKKRAWQEFFYERLNRQHVPFEPICTPFMFLEMIGIPLQSRPNLPAIRFKNSDSIPTKGLGELVGNRLKEFIGLSKTYFENEKYLSSGEMIAAANIRCNLFTDRHDYARKLADYTYQEFKRKDEFDDAVYTFLALDHLQHHLESDHKSREARLARMQLLKDILDLITQGYNFPLFRLLRTIWRDFEKLKMKRGSKSVLSLKSLGDLVDTDYIHYATIGYMRKGSLKPVTIFTWDPLKQVETRLKIARHLLRIYTQEILMKPLERSGIVLPKFVPGKIIVCDELHSKVIKEVEVAGLDSEIEGVELKEAV